MRRSPIRYNPRFPREPAVSEHADKTPAQSKAMKADESIKETFESIVIAFILAFVFRAYVVEAFVIPTGSMAPTLLGQHFRVTCSQCGYGFVADGPDGGKPLPVRSTTNALCPMCHYPNPLPRGGAPLAGDRILVHKYIYSFVEPRRWDVIVFKAPHDPDINFIKRLVGLPNESVAIIEGNVYVQRHTSGNEPPTPWLIARKTDRPRVQETVWQPVYRTPYVPLDEGDDDLSPERVSHGWSQPWVADDAEAWMIEPRRGFTHTGEGDGTLRFDFRRALAGGPGLYVYNHLRRYGGDGLADDEPIEDIRLAVNVQAHAWKSALTLTTTARLDDERGARPLHARIHADGSAELATLDPRTGENRILDSAMPDKVPALMPGRTRRVELWYVDQQVSLWIDGQRILMWQYDLPHNQDLRQSLIVRRPGPAMFPDLSITVSGSPVTLHRIELDRDLFYGSVAEGGSAPADRAGIVKLGRHDRTFDGRPVSLTVDEFFVLGDNSPQSSDSRFWKTVNPWVLDRMFQPEHPAPLGIVPRRLLIGRAFFVYFPGPFYVGRLPVPNFGQMRFIH